MDDSIVWSAYEYAYTEKGSDWFWALGIIAVSGAIVAFLFQNILFAILILVGAFTLALLSRTPPKERTFALTPRGVMIDTALYAYDTLVAFDIHEYEHAEPMLIIDARRFLTPNLIISLAGVDVDAVREYLAAHLTEEALGESPIQRFAEYLGF